MGGLGTIEKPWKRKGIKTIKCFLLSQNCRIIGLVVSRDSQISHADSPKQ
jgi:hypothetical protein